MSHKTLKVHAHRNAGHPWDQKSGFDLLYVEANTSAEFDAAIAVAIKKHWHPWLLGLCERTGMPGGVLYKPCGVNVPWEDGPLHRHPGNAPDEAVVDALSTCLEASNDEDRSLECGM